MVLQGLLAPHMEAVNMVSAPAIAKERNIDVGEARHETAGAYQSLIRVTVETDVKTSVIAGTLFNESPRIVEIGNISIDAEMGPHMLYVTNQDKPGFIGALGTTLAEAGINIATFHLGRTESGGDAVCLVEVDGQVPDAVVAKVRGLPHVVRAITLSF